MIDELRGLLAEFYAIGCEHDNYAYALSDEMNALIDKTILKNFVDEYNRLSLRCNLTESEEEYVLDRMNKQRIPKWRRVWYKFFRRYPNDAAKYADSMMSGNEPYYYEAMIARIERIEQEIAASKQMCRDEPPGDGSEEEAREAGGADESAEGEAPAVDEAQGADEADGSAEPPDEGDKEPEAPAEPPEEGEGGEDWNEEWDDEEPPDEDDKEPEAPTEPDGEADGDEADEDEPTGDTE